MSDNSEGGSKTFAGEVKIHLQESKTKVVTILNDSSINYNIYSIGRSKHKSLTQKEREREKRRLVERWVSKTAASAPLLPGLERKV